MKNKDGRCQKCCGFDADSRQCQVYKPWGLTYMEQEDCTFFEFHKDRQKKLCTGCKYFEFTETIGSPHKKEWHCHDGFTPTADCKQMAARNEQITRDYYRKYPEELQLKIKF